MNEVDYKTKTMKTTLIALITLLLAATAPAQESIQYQLDQIAQAERDAEGAYSTDAIMRQAEADRAAWERQLQATAQQNFRDCVELGSSPAECARLWLH